MKKKMQALTTKAYVEVNSLVSALKEDQRGLSGIVVAVMLILVAVLAVGMLNDQLSSWMTELWGDITGNNDVTSNWGSN